MASLTRRNSPWAGRSTPSGSSPRPASRRAISSATRPSSRERTSRWWWSSPSGKRKSAARNRSFSTPSGPFWRSQRMPSATGTRQAGRLGNPSIRIRHWPQEPAKQNGPRGRWYLIERVNVVTPARSSAAATVSCACASMGAPSREIRGIRRRSACPSAAAHRSRSSPALHPRPCSRSRRWSRRRTPPIPGRSRSHRSPSACRPASGGRG